MREIGARGEKQPGERGKPREEFQKRERREREGR